MGLFSNKISRDNLKAGDHIYSWRKAYIYSHHGIYVGNGKVIHFTRGGGLETGTGTSLDKVIVSSVPNHGGDKPCRNCRDQSILDGVMSSCLDCFLAGGNLYLFEYGVSQAIFIANPRGGTCTTAPSDSSDEVISRANFLLLRNGFGLYHLLENNCEDFAIYCKTGLVVFSQIKLGSSGQANSASVAKSVLVSLAATLLEVVKTGGKTALVVSSTLGTFTGIGSIVLEGCSKYCLDRLSSDIGVRSDVLKVPVERLSDVMEFMGGRLDNKCTISREFDLLASLQVIVKGDRDLSEYIKEFKSLCDLLSSIGKPVSEPMKIFWLLQGLGKEYESFATTIQTSMHKPPAPTYNEVVSMLKDFDGRIKSSASVHLAFQAKSSNAEQISQEGNTGQYNYGHQSYGNRGRGNYSNRFGNSRGRGNYTSRGRGFPQQVNTSGTNGNNSGQQQNQSSKRPTCQICGRVGHVALKCCNNSGQQQNQSSNRPTCQICGRVGHVAFKCWNNSGQQQNLSSKRPTCQICGRVGHVALKCWNIFDNSYQSNDIPQALAAMHISGQSNREWYPDSGASAHITTNTCNKQHLTMVQKM